MHNILGCRSLHSKISKNLPCLLNLTNYQGVGIFSKVEVATLTSERAGNPETTSATHGDYPVHTAVMMLEFWYSFFQFHHLWDFVQQLFIGSRDGQSSRMEGCRKEPVTTSIICSRSRFESSSEGPCVSLPERAWAFEKWIWRFNPSLLARWPFHDSSFITQIVT